MFPHAIVGVDFSPGGEVLIRSLPTLRQLGTERLTLVHALDVTYPVGGTIDFQQAYRTHIKALEERARAFGFDATAELIVGSPSREIAAVARDAGASLIVVGSRGQSRLSEAFLGSVSWGVIKHADIPVLVVRIEPAGGAEDSPFEALHPQGFERALFPTDWSDAADNAFQHLERLARHGEITAFTLLHTRDAVEEARTGKSTEAEDKRRLEGLAERLRSAGAASVEFDALSGAPAQEIIRRADERGGTLVVMATHGRGAVGDAFLGSVSHEVLRKSRSGILLVPPNA